MRGLGTGLALLAAVGWSTATFAATVNVNSGTVSINGGKPTASSTPAKVGDAVSAGPKGDATIVYDNGCIMRVAAGSTVSVVTDEQCALAQAGTTGPTIAGIGGTGLVVGSLAVAGAVGIGIAASNGGGSKSKNRAASP